MSEVPTVPTEPVPQPEVRKFGDAAIQSAVEDALMGVPADHHVAFVAHADLTDVRVAVMVRLGANWSLAGYMDKQYTGPLSGGAEVRFSA